MDMNRFTAPYDYTTHRNMGLVSMSWVNQALGEMRAGVTQFAPNSLRFPLHPSQMESLMRTVAIAQDPRMFGAAGLPAPSETIDQYTQRIAALALSSGKEREFVFAVRRNGFF